MERILTSDESGEEVEEEMVEEAGENGYSTEEVIVEEAGEDGDLVEEITEEAGDDEVELLEQPDEPDEGGAGQVVEGSWSVVDEARDERASQQPEFRGEAGVHPGIAVPKNTLREYFEIFFTERMVNEVTEGTNARAWEELRRIEMELGDQPLPARLAEWRDCTRDEIKKVIAIVFYMGVVHIPEMKNYWATSKFYETHCFKRKAASVAIASSRSCLS